MLAFGLPLWVVSLGAWWFSGLMGIILYWLPLISCIVVYTLKGIKIYFKLRKERVGEGKESWFDPDDLTVGHIIGFTIISVCPGVNLIAFMKECAWEILSFIWSRCEKFFTASLVPDNERYEQIRKMKNKR